MQLSYARFVIRLWVYSGGRWGHVWVFFLSLQDFSLLVELLHYCTLSQECCRDQPCTLIKCHYPSSPTLSLDKALGKSHSPRVKWAKKAFGSSAPLTISADIELSLLEHEV